MKEDKIKVMIHGIAKQVANELAEGIKKDIRQLVRDEVQAAMSYGFMSLREGLMQPAPQHYAPPVQPYAPQPAAPAPNPRREEVMRRMAEARDLYGDHGMGQPAPREPEMSAEERANLRRKKLEENKAHRAEESFIRSHKAKELSEEGVSMDVLDVIMRGSADQVGHVAKMVPPHWRKVD